VTPLISKDDLEKAKQSVDRFKEGSGKSLQDKLKKRAKELEGNGSYVEEFWYNGYLSPKESVVLNLNPFFVLEDDPTPARNEQVKRGASLLYSAVRFVWKLWNEELVPDMWRKTPLDMSQYCRLFGSCRIPRKGDDEHVTFPRSACRHVVVVCESQFFCFNVLDEDGNISVSEKSLRQVLTAILEDASSEDRLASAQSAVGVFTTSKRKDWAVRRKQLAEISEDNATALKTIDTAMFVMCLDSTSPGSIEALASNALHGSYAISQDGTSQIGTCTNRWFDKLQLIVCGNGKAAINFEHTAVDGHTVLRFASDVFADTILRFAQSITRTTHGADYLRSVLDPLPPEESMSPVSKRRTRQASAEKSIADLEARRLEFVLTPELKRSLFYAEVQLSDLIAQNETRVLEFEEFGKRFITSNKMSPDAFVQLAMMAAYFRLHGRAVSVYVLVVSYSLSHTHFLCHTHTHTHRYESVQTKHFFHGRTAAARPMTAEAKALCERLVELWDTRHRSQSTLSGASSGSLDTTDEAVERRNRRVQLRKKLRDAILVAAKAHVREVKAAAKGQDVDRHLYALLCLARQNGDEIPDLFQTEAWHSLNHTVLSTSNCGNPSLRLFGFGPVSPDGYGLGYIIKDGGLSFCAASKNRQTGRYLGMLKKTLRLFRSVLTSTSNISTPKRIRKKTIMMSSGYGFFDSGE